MKTEKEEKNIRMTINIFLNLSVLSILIIWDPGMVQKGSADKGNLILTFTLFFYTVAALIIMHNKIISYFLRFYGILYTLIFTFFLYFFIHIQIEENFAYLNRTMQLALTILIGWVWCFYTVYKNFTYKK